MQIKKSIYTYEEVEKILECVAENPGNLTKAFDEASSKLDGRSANSIKKYYYRVVRPRNPIVSVSSSIITYPGKNKSDELEEIFNLIKSKKIPSAEPQTELEKLLTETSLEDVVKVIKSLPFMTRRVVINKLKNHGRN